MLKRFLPWLAIALAAVAAGTSALYVRDMRRAYERIRGKSTIVSSPFGDIEFAQGGIGPAVLVIHGSGGGFDQGKLIVRAVVGDRVHWIAPSRFGYLRSTFRARATFDEQAHAYAYLLDHLRIQNAAVVALSHGGPSALLFAALHPDRVTSLTLISAGVASSADANQSEANQKGDALTAIFRRDYRYWAVTTVFRNWFLELMGVTDAVIAGLAKDDTLQLYRNAEFAAATIPRARLVSFERGGHLVVAVQQATIRTLIEEHILVHANQ